MGKDTKNTAFVIMEYVGDMWAPAAVYTDGETARRVTETLHMRLFGTHKGHDDTRWDSSLKFEAWEVPLEPEIIETGRQRYYALLPDEPEWEAELYPDNREALEPGDLWNDATALERGECPSEELTLKEPPNDQPR